MQHLFWGRGTQGGEYRYVHYAKRGHFIEVSQQMSLIVACQAVFENHWNEYFVSICMRFFSSG